MRITPFHVPARSTVNANQTNEAMLDALVRWAAKIVNA